ncbi:MAG: sulfite exporter TauE/SafE family protein [Proteobacteria bacterium]|nr:sulfite exporter TauE/SafE family protein [Pseudomonadota bacterium]
MEAALYASALALGLAGSPHCVAMCAAPCAAVTGGQGRPQLAFHLARAAAYAAAGALAAASVNSLGLLAAASPMFKPLWSLVHAAALALGLWLLVMGRQPAWIERIGRRPVTDAGAGAGARGGWQLMRAPGRSTRAAAAGALWVAWPCGLLQSAILVAALANTPLGGAGVMLVFAMATAAGLLAGPWLWRRLRPAPGGGAGAAGVGTLGVRVAGALLAVASSFALFKGAWAAVAAYCGL